MAGNALSVEVLASEHLARVASRTCAWCHSVEDTVCTCTRDCGDRDCPVGLAAEGVSPFGSSPIPVPRFR